MEAEVKIEISMQHVKVPVSVNGKGPFSFTLDTGASVTTISKRIAEELEIETRAGSRSEARGVGGGIPVQYADVEIGMGTLEFAKDEVYVLDFDAIFQYVTITDTLYIGNTGCNVLEINDITLNLSEFSVDTLVRVSGYEPSLYIYGKDVDQAVYWNYILTEDINA